MAYSPEEKNKIVETICDEIIQGKSLREALELVSLSYKVFYQWIDDDEDKSKLYARACSIRADNIFEDILNIADHTDEDHTPFTGGNVVQRDRTRIDARKWMLAKMMPKKYGERLDVDHTTGGEKINVINLGSGVKPPEND